MLARIKPFDPKRGHIARSITFPALNSARFEVGRWYDLAALAKSLNRSEQEIIGVLEQHRMDYSNPSSPLAFDIVTAEGADALAEVDLRAVARVAPTPKAPEVPATVAPGPSATQHPRQTHAVPQRRGGR
jgi:hypothetical protein